MGQFVAGELVDDELVVREIIVESFDDPVSVKPGRPGLIFFKSIRVGVAGGIQPLACPAFTIVNGSEQPFDLLFIGVRAGVGKKGIQFLDRGGQANQVEARATEQSRFVRFRRRLKMLLLKPV